MTKTITLIRQIKGREHKTILKEDCSLHVDILEKLFNKCLSRGIMIEIDDLIDTIIRRQ